MSVAAVVGSPPVASRAVAGASRVAAGPEVGRLHGLDPPPEEGHEPVLWGRWQPRQCVCGLAAITATAAAAPSGCWGRRSRSRLHSRRDAPAAHGGLAPRLPLAVEAVARAGGRARGHLFGHGSRRHRLAPRLPLAVEAVARVGRWARRTHGVVGGEGPLRHWGPPGAPWARVGEVHPPRRAAPARWPRRPRGHRDGRPGDRLCGHFQMPPTVRKLAAAAPLAAVVAPVAAVRGRAGEACARGQVPRRLAGCWTVEVRVPCGGVYPPLPQAPAHWLCSAPFRISVVRRLRLGFLKFGFALVAVVFIAVTAVTAGTFYRLLVSNSLPCSLYQKRLRRGKAE